MLVLTLQSAVDPLFSENERSGSIEMTLDELLSIRLPHGSPAYMHECTFIFISANFPKVAYVLICYIFLSTIIYVLQGSSGYKVHLPNLAQKLKKSTGKALLMNNLESFIPSKQSMMDTCFKHKGKCCLAVTWKSGNMQWFLEFTMVWANRSNVCGIIFWRKQ